MPRSKEQRKRKPFNTENLSKAVKMVIDKKMTTYYAALHFNVPKTTLRSHLKHCRKSGTNESTLHDNLAVNQVFDRENQRKLVNYINEAANLLYGLTLNNVKALAYKFAKETQQKYPKSWDTKKMAGDVWLRLFRKRWQNELLLLKPEGSSARSSAFNTYTVGLTFGHFKEALSKCPDIKATDIWNVDETELVPPKVLTLPSLEIKPIGSDTNAKGEISVTIMAAINAGGGYIPPMLIFPENNFKESMLCGAPQSSIGGANPSGWVNETLFVAFLEHFIEHTKSTKEEPVILILDTHDSHISLQAIQTAKDNGVMLVTQHPNTNDYMQPLVKSVFGPLKNIFTSEAYKLLMTPDREAKPLTIYDIAVLVGKAFPFAFTPKNICEGFSSTGFHPLNENIYDYNDFKASSNSESTLVENSSTETYGVPLTEALDMLIPTES